MHSCLSRFGFLGPLLYYPPRLKAERAAFPRSNQNRSSSSVRSSKPKDHSPTGQGSTPYSANPHTRPAHRCRQPPRKWSVAVPCSLLLCFPSLRAGATISRQEGQVKVVVEAVAEAKVKIMLLQTSGVTERLCFRKKRREVQGTAKQDAARTTKGENQVAWPLSFGCLNCRGQGICCKSKKAENSAGRTAAHRCSSTPCSVVLACSLRDFFLAGRHAHF